MPRWARRWPQLLRSDVSTNLVGASVNTGGTKIATAKLVGTGTLNTTDKGGDSNTVISHGAMSIPVKAAINMGILRRNAAGVLEELKPAQPHTRQG